MSELDWIRLEAEVSGIITELLEHGSQGIAEYMATFYGLVKQFESGERTETLYNALQSEIAHYNHQQQQVRR